MTIVILGAGEIGGALARHLAAADAVSRIVIVDEAATAASGKALDIAQAGPVDRYSTSVVGASEIDVVVGASVVVLADRFGHAQGEWTGDAGLALLTRVAAFNRQAPIVCAGAAQSGLVSRGVSELGLPYTRLFGSAPEAMRGAITALVALEADAAPAEVTLGLLGRAPTELIVPWDAASIGGRRATDVVPPHALLRLEDRLPRLWPPGPTSLGSAAALIIRSMIARAPRSFAVDVAAPHAERRALSAILPARLGPSGITRLEPPSLSSRDRVRLETSLAR